MLDWRNLPPGSPMWLTVGSVLFSALMVSWPKIGAMARWVADRDLREIEKKQTIEEKIDEAVAKRTTQIEARLSKVEKELEAEREDREKERAWYRSEIERRDEEIRDLNLHAEASVKREYQIQEWAASLGLEPPEPKIQLYAVWRKALREAREDR